MSKMGAYEWCGPMQILASVNLGLNLSCGLSLPDETCRQNEQGAPRGRWHLMPPTAPDTKSGKGEALGWVATSIAMSGREGARAGSVGMTNYK